MTDVTWGDPIEVNGKRPEWFDLPRGPLGYKRAHEKTWFGPGNIWSETDILNGDDAGWSSVTHLILPANHSYYSTIALPSDWAIVAAYRRIFPDSSYIDDIIILEAYSHERNLRSPGIEAALWVARMIEKYEPELAPVDPDVLAVREILAATSDINDGEEYRSGKCDGWSHFIRALAAYRKVVAARG